MCLSDRLKLAMTHAFYVAGLTFFSIMSTQFIDQRITATEIYVCMVAASISFGISFFTSMSLQAKNGIEGTTKPKTSRKATLTFINRQNKELNSEKFLITVHNPHGEWGRK